MKSLRIAIQFDDETISPEHAVLCESPSVDRQLILGGHVSEGTETTISYVEGEPEAYETIFDADHAVEEYDIAEAGAGFFCYVRQRLGASGLTTFEAFQQETIVVVPPFELRPDGTMRCTVVGSPEDLQAVIDGVPDGMTVEVLRVGDHAGGPIGDLSTRQRDAIQVAWDRGYYEVPRSGGIEEVAGALDCAVSTASDLLRRAESRLVANALDEPR